MYRLVANLHLPLGLYALNGGVVELVAIDRVGYHAAMGASARNREPYQQGNGRLTQAFAEFGRRAAAVLHMAAAAGAGNKVGAQAVAGGGRGGCLHPIAAEERITHGKPGPLLVVQGGQWHGECIAPGDKCSRLVRGQFALAAAGGVTVAVAPYGPEQGGNRTRRRDQQPQFLAGAQLHCAWANLWMPKAAAASVKSLDC